MYRLWYPRHTRGINGLVNERGCITWVYSCRFNRASWVWIKRLISHNFRGHFPSALNTTRLFPLTLEANHTRPPVFRSKTMDADDNRRRISRLPPYCCYAILPFLFNIRSHWLERAVCYFTYGRNFHSRNILCKLCRFPANKHSPIRLELS